MMSTMSKIMIASGVTVTTAISVQSAATMQQPRVSTLKHNNKVRIGKQLKKLARGASYEPSKGWQNILMPDGSIQIGQVFTDGTVKFCQNPSKVQRFYKSEWTGDMKAKNFDLVYHPEHPDCPATQPEVDVLAAIQEASPSERHITDLDAITINRKFEGCSQASVFNTFEQFPGKSTDAEGVATADSDDEPTEEVAPVEEVCPPVERVTIPQENKKMRRTSTAFMKAHANFSIPEEPKQVRWSLPTFFASETIAEEDDVDTAHLDSEAIEILPVTNVAGEIQEGMQLEGCFANGDNPFASV